MGDYKRKMQTDAVGYFNKFFREKKYKAICYFYSFFMPCVLSAKKIKSGKANKFYRIPYFFRFPESEITIGSKCIFDSSKLKNLIGVNKRCIVATLAKNARLRIGDNSGFSGVRIGCAESITIGNDCFVGANVTITDTDWHAINPEKRNDGNAIETKPVKIGNNVFIGLNTIILKGTEIGDNSVIGAGSVVSGKIPANVIAAGNPCKVIKNI